MKYPPVSAESVSCVGVGFMAHNKVDDERIENTDYVFILGMLAIYEVHCCCEPVTIRGRHCDYVSCRPSLFAISVLGGFANTRGSAQEQGGKKHNSNPATDRSIKTDRQLE